MVSYAGAQKKQGFSRVMTRPGSRVQDQEVFKTSRVELGWVTGGVWEPRGSDRVESGGFQISRVRAGSPLDSTRGK